MDAKKDLWNYTVKNYSSKDYYTFMYTNKLQFLYEAELMPYMTSKERKEHEAYKKTNYIREKIRFAEMTHINSMLSKSGITPIHFKGYTLAYILFGNKNIRDVGDMDIYIEDEYFDKAYRLLSEYGFNIFPGFTPEEKHHVAMGKGTIYLELHRSIIKPETKINYKYLIEHTNELNISGSKILTFDVTATLLYMIYHAYSHMESAGKGITRKHMFEHKYIYMYPYTVRHMFEIALYIEKYNKEINWTDFLDDVKKQDLNRFFKELIININLLFPEHLPNQVYIELMNLKYQMRPAFIHMADVFAMKNNGEEINPTVLFTKLFNKYWHGCCVSINNKGTSDWIPAVNSPFFYINTEYFLKIKEDKICFIINMKKELCFNQLKNSKMFLTLVNADGYYSFFELLIDIDFENRHMKLINMIVPSVPVDLSLISANFNSDENDEHVSISVEILLSALTDKKNISDETYIDLHFEDAYEYGQHEQYKDFQYDPYSFSKLIY